MSKQKVFVCGVGMSPFIKPGSHEKTYIEIGQEAAERALFDSGVDFNDIQAGYVGYVYLPSCAGQNILYKLGMNGIPIVNVNNNCATGSTAFNLAYKAIQYGQIDCAIALGVDIMFKGPLKMDTGTTSPVFENMKPLIEQGKFDMNVPPVPQLFGTAGKEHMDLYGTTFDQISKITVKNYKHGSNNPYAQFQKPVDCEFVKNSQMICYPLTKLNCCPTSDGAACVVLCSENYIKKNSKNNPDLQNKAVEVLSSILGTDTRITFEDKSLMSRIGYHLANRVANEAYKEANVTSKDIRVIELHDCFAANELLMYEALDLCEKGTAGKFIDEGNNTYGGKYVINPSGGLTSKGHPLGATGLAQITELCWQLRGLSGKRQVENVKYAMSHNLGLGSAVVISIFKKYNEKYEDLKSTDPKDIDKEIKKNGVKGTTKF